MDKETVCLMPWRGVYTTVRNDIAPCCIIKPPGRAPYNEGDEFGDVYNNEYFKDIRKAIKNGEVHEMCRKCINRKKYGVSDNPSTVNNLYTEEEMIDIINDTNDDGSIDKDKISIEYMDLMTSNTCNLTCRSCSPFSSSSWGKYQPNKRLIATDRNRNITDEFVDYIGDVRRVYFKGGEPFLMPEHKKIVEAILANNPKNTRIGYYTNGTIVDNKYVEYLKTVWPEFRSVNLTFSIDGYKEMGEYTRQGLNWEEFVENYNYIKSLGIVSTRLKATLSNINIWHFPDMIKGFVNDGLLPRDMYDISQLLGIGPVVKTDGLLLSQIPYETKLLIKERFEELEHWLNLNTEWSDDSIRFCSSILKFVFEYNDYDAELTTSEINKMDALFGTSFYKVQPEYAPLLIKK